MFPSRVTFGLDNFNSELQNYLCSEILKPENLLIHGEPSPTQEELGGWRDTILKVLGDDPNKSYVVTIPYDYMATDLLVALIDSHCLLFILPRIKIELSVRNSKVELDIFDSELGYPEYYDIMMVEGKMAKYLADQVSAGNYEIISKNPPSENP